MRKSGKLGDVVLAGGGIDSSVLIAHLVKSGARFTALHFDYGQKACRAEREALTVLCARYKVPLRIDRLDVPLHSSASILRETPRNDVNEKRRNRLELRNPLLVVAAGMFALAEGGDTIYLGFHAEPPGAPFPDATPLARRAMSAMLATCTLKPLRVEAPFERWSRQVIVEYGWKLDPRLITESMTCYEPVLLQECGECVHCKKKAAMVAKLKKKAA